MSDEHEVQPASITLGPSGLPHLPTLVDELRHLVAADDRVVAIHLLSGEFSGIGDREVIGVDLGDGHVDPSDLMATVERAAEPLLPEGTRYELVVLSGPWLGEARFLAPPIGAGGAVEIAAARALRDPQQTLELLERLVEAEVYVAAAPDEAAAGMVGSATPDRPLPLDPGEPIGLPVIEWRGAKVVPVHSSLSALIHLWQEPRPVLAMTGLQLLAGWPDDLGLSLDLGCAHGQVFQASDMTWIREGAQQRPPGPDGGPGGEHDAG